MPEIAIETCHAHLSPYLLYGNMVHLWQLNIKYSNHYSFATFFILLPNIQLKDSTEFFQSNQAKSSNTVSKSSRLLQSNEILHVGYACIHDIPSGDLEFIQVFS